MSSVQRVSSPVSSVPNRSYRTIVSWREAGNGEIVPGSSSSPGSLPSSAAEALLGFALLALLYFQAGNCEFSKRLRRTSVVKTNLIG